MSLLVEYLLLQLCIHQVIYCLTAHVDSLLINSVQLSAMITIPTDKGAIVIIDSSAIIKAIIVRVY
jgi:hypothetical protein